MISVTVQTLVITGPSSPSVLVLCPTEDFNAHKNCRIIPIWVGLNEATQLGMALEGHKVARPMTHDLFMDALTNLDTCVSRVEIFDVKGQTFYAHLILRTGDRIITLDARPSDAIALAIRQNAPVYITEDVLDRASFPYLFKHDRDDEEELAEFHSFVQTISPDDFNDDELLDDGGFNSSDPLPSA